MCPKIIKKICVECGKEFLGDSRPHHQRCSMICRSNSVKLNKIHSKNAKKYKDNNNPNWKGNKVGKVGLHLWILKKLGAPTKCKFCDKMNIPGKDGRRTIQWANKSGKYLRKLSDWLPLCVSCHLKYDRKKRIISN